MESIISYAQNFEDVMLWRALGHVQNGRYIDVGAQSPDIDSVSRLFHERGWHGIHVEPSVAYAAALRVARPQDQVIEAAVTDMPGTIRFFEIADTGLSTTREDIALHHAEEGFAASECVVDAITLDEVFSRAGEDDIHWLKIDVEGAEAAVLRSWKGGARPWIVIVESTRPLTRSDIHSDWDHLLVAKDYRFAWFDGLNRYYVADTHPELLDAFVLPPNLFDDFAFSGTASAPFCRLVNREREAAVAAAEARVHELHQRANAERAWREAEQAGRQADRAELGAERDALAVRMATIETLRAAIESTREALQGDIEDLKTNRDALQADRDALKTNRDALQAERDALKNDRDALQADRDALKTNRDALQAERDALKNDRDALQADLDALEVRRTDEQAAAAIRERTLSRQLAAARAESQRAADEGLVTRGRLDIALHEAHRWWVEAEGLRGERDELLASHSWRITAPIRAVRRVVSNPGPYLSAMANSVLSRVMRVVVASPLRRPAQATLAYIPGVRSRMRAIAVEHRVIPGLHAPAAVPLVDAVSPHLPMSAEARRIHARLRRALAREQV